MNKNIQKELQMKDKKIDELGKVIQEMKEQIIGLTKEMSIIQNNLHINKHELIEDNKQDLQDNEFTFDLNKVSSGISLRKSNKIMSCLKTDNKLKTCFVNNRFNHGHNAGITFKINEFDEGICVGIMECAQSLRIDINKAIPSSDLDCFYVNPNGILGGNQSCGLLLNDVKALHVGEEIYCYDNYFKRYKLAKIEKVYANNDGVRVHWLGYSTKWDEDIKKMDFKKRLKHNNGGIFKFKKNSIVQIDFLYDKMGDKSLVKFRTNDYKFLDIQLQKNCNWIPYVYINTKNKIEIEIVD